MAIPRVAVAFGGFGCQLISEGIITAMDVFPPYIFNYFKCTIAEASLFHSVLHGLSELLGPVSSYLTRHFSDRKVMWMGATAACSGFIICSFSFTLWELVLGSSISGIGFGLVSVPVVTVISFHFKKYRYAATAAATTGGAIGAVLFPFIFDAILQQNPWQFAFFVVSCFAAQLFVFGSLLVRPNEPEAPVTKSPSQEELETYSGEVTAISEKEVRVTELRPLPFFGRFVVPILLLSSFLWHIGHYTYEVMPLRLDHEGYNGDQIALVVSLQAIFVVVGRFSASSVTTKFKADPVFAYTFFTLIFAIARIIISWTWALKSYLVIIAFCGVSIGVVTALMPCVVLKLVGLERLDFIFGLELLVRGIGGIVMPVFGGWLADVFDQNYFYTFMVGGISLLLSAILLIPYHWPLLRAAEIENTKVEKR